MKKKFIISIMAALLVFIGIGVNEKFQSASEDQEIFDMMETAAKENRALTSEEAKTINEFYMYKHLDKRGDELDYSLNMMFNTFGTEAYDEFKERAEKELK